MTLSSASASVPDLLRLLAVPVFAWAAVLDVRTRRVPSAVWIPLGALGAALLVWDGWVAARSSVLAWESFLIPAALSLGFVVPLAYLFWWGGGFGGADAKALMVLALLFPVVPRYAAGGWALPVAPGATTVPFSLSILANGVLVGLAIPAVLAIRNAFAGRTSPVMLVGWPVATERVPTTHGRLLETPDGLTLGGADLDAIRMYLRWRGLSLAELRENPDRFRDPASLPDAFNPPTDGAVEAASLLPDGGEVTDDADGAASTSDDVDEGGTTEGGEDGTGEGVEDGAGVTDGEAPKHAGDVDDGDDIEAGNDVDDDADTVSGNGVDDGDTVAGDGVEASGEEDRIGDEREERDDAPVGVTGDRATDDADGAGALDDAEELVDADAPDDVDAESPDAAYEDPWGAAAFLDSIEGSAYGTSASDLRDGLEVLAERDTVWISPGTPFLVPLFVGLLIALVYGDLLVTVMA